MASDETEIARAAEALHEEIPRTVQVSLSMSKDTRDLLADIRDELNESAGTPILETNDVIRLALLGATRCDEVLADPEIDFPPPDDGLAVLLSPLAARVRNDEHLTADTD